MCNLLRLVLCLCLSLALGLAGVRTALACPAEAVMAVAACGHDGVIWLDASGAPVKPAAHCPDCLGTAALEGVSPPAPSRPAALRAERLTVFVPALPSSPPQRPVPRGPPALA